MIKNILDIFKYVFSGKFIDDSVDSYNKRLQNKIEKENLRIKIAKIKYEANDNDNVFMEKVFNLPSKEFHLFMVEYKDTYDAMILEKKRRLKILLKGVN